MAGKWNVVRQQQSERLVPGGTFESIVTITFQLASGTIGSVVVPSRLYTEEYARQVIDAQATTMAAIENLQG